jgi:hypothetical protein
LAAARPHRRVCYCPAIFFRHIRAFAFSFPKETFGALLKKVIPIFLLFGNCDSLKLPRPLPHYASFGDRTQLNIGL